MLAVKGIYNGSTVQLLEQVEQKKPCYVAVTFLEPFHLKDLDERKMKLLSLCGSWEDNRSPEEIIEDIHKSKKINAEVRKVVNNLGIILLVIFVTLVSGCTEKVTEKEKKIVRLRMSSTTSTDNTGLFEALNPPFEEKYRARVDVIAVGTGKALKLAQNGDVDLTLVHSKEREVKFVEEGYGVNRREVMANYFMIAGPTSDPAGIKTAKTAGEAFQKIAEAKISFVSRGDNSGTHIREKTIWKEAGITPSGNWYLESGQGMDATLIMADEKQAYTLVDRGTYLKYLDKIEIRGVFEAASEALYNPYGIIVVNPARHPHVNYSLAMTYIDWVTSPEGQKIIADFTDKTGQRLFTPLAIPTKN